METEKLLSVCPTQHAPPLESHPSVSVVALEALSRVQLSCSPKDCSPPGSSLHGIPRARILEGVGISFSRGSS